MCMAVFLSDIRAALADSLLADAADETENLPTLATACDGLDGDEGQEPEGD